ncbi:uncharacterized protein LTR77_005717 [Saxophila tyrrhenica]|uniref:Uncharacterized protein n=1 Tax=Saxophila tyrrhenica TaxID=1690608 RepID=A0AAV9P993_9PEZI|nr:hypothetical protein LTR77_005717 [Saxophila tyrrhenica]
MQSCDWSLQLRAILPFDNTDLQSHTSGHYITMPSNLRLQSTFDPIDAQAVHQTSPTLPPRKKQKMSLTQTYYIASTARRQLGKEASAADHNLRRLVGHANLLDNLMEELQSAEREQENWFNQSVRAASKPEEPKHIQWLDQIDEADDSDSDDSDMEDDEEFENSPSSFVPVFDDNDDLDWDNQELTLTRTPSHKQSSPPELTMEEDEYSSDEDECPSPGNVALEMSEKERQDIATAALYDLKSQNGMEDYLSGPIAAC